ncbi:MAG: hypothetical protein R3C70_09555 [Geminicoccaceae bacterium]
MTMRTGIRYVLERPLGSNALIGQFLGLEGGRSQIEERSRDASSTSALPPAGTSSPASSTISISMHWSVPSFIATIST